MGQVIQNQNNQSTPSLPPQGIENPPSQEKIAFLKSKLFIYIAAGIGALIVLFILLFFLTGKSRAATIAGVINYTALKPDPGDRGQVQIKYRKYKSTGDYIIVYASGLAEKSPWAWNDAVSGQPYEMIASLQVDGKLVTTSEPLIVTAPAANQELNLHVTWHDLPESVVIEQTTYIKGTVTINGYIPPQNTLFIQARLPTDQDFQTVVTTTNAGQKNGWKWDKTVPLKDYMIKAVLMQGVITLATSETVTAAGGDSKIDFILNSTAVPPANPPVSPSPNNPTPVPQQTTGNITGTVFINGPEQENTSLLMLWRLPGNQNYNVITRINNPSHNGQPWSWNNLTVGKQYEITGVLQVNQQNTASTQSQIITVPAQNINFTLNTGVFIPTPSGNVIVNACNSLGNNQYNAVISFPRQSTAGNYWIQVGRSAATADMYNSKIQANNPQITVQIDGNRSYYAQYAYSLCMNCSDDSNFSNFSQSTPFSCGGGPAYTGYVCNTSSYTCELTTQNNPPYPFNNTGLTQCQQNCRPAPTSTPQPTPTATPLPTAAPTPTPKIAYCNQTCGSNGYECDGNLTCVSGEGLGSSVCRNPDCTSEKSCNCLPQ
ncbi:MAG: hypothetical protein M1268_01485 [Patescibacteria group bacterium]|nr:hypothetical protein [Actinomycetota bacterium]MCL5438641.1 hypothetical protein [Patescibacteria group bacterium]